MSDHIKALVRRANTPSSVNVLLVAVALPVVLLFPFVASSDYILYLAIATLGYVLAAQGLNFLYGNTAILSLAQSALFAIGAYTTAIATVDHGMNPWLALACAGALGGLASVPIALPANRLSTWYFVLITLALALLVRQALTDFEGLTHGYSGVIGVPMPSLGSHVFSLRDLFWLLALVNVAGALLLRNVLKSRIGRAMAALKAGDVVAASHAVPSAMLKMFAFVVSGVFAGVAGGFYAMSKIVVTPDDFEIHLGITFIVFVVLGGTGSLIGPFLGTAVFYLLPEVFQGLDEYSVIMAGVVLLLVMYFMPGGLAAGVTGLWRRIVRWAGAELRIFPTLTTSGQRHLMSDRALARVAAPGSAGTLDTRAGKGLEVAGISKRFGGLQALDDVHLALRAGTVHGLVGPNGSGKTTTLNIVSGLYRPDSGTVSIDGRDITRQRTIARAKAGMARTFQTPQLLPGLTVVENVMLGTNSRGGHGLFEIAAASPRVRSEERHLIDQSLEALSKVGLEQSSFLDVGELSHGQQRLVEIARSLVSEPSVFLLDEPAAGLSGTEIDRLIEALMTAKEMGMGILLVEHRIELVQGVADEVTVLDRGRVLASGTTDVLEQADVVNAYMGPKL